MDVFRGRKLVIATQHRKEQVIAPLLEQELGAKVTPSRGLNTDQFGTFTGESPRELTPHETLRQKCLKGIDHNGTDLAVASEGSFGSHPVLIFMPSDEEWVMLMDRKNDIEVTGRKLSTQTNFAGRDIETEEELTQFAETAEFPSHALVIKTGQYQFVHVYKGITDSQKLKEAFRQIKNQQPTVWVETDMRAMYNPTRLEVIKEATQNLIDNLKSLCPECGAPGFVIKDMVKGLPCEICQMPTRSAKAYRYACQKCQYIQEIPNSKPFEEASHCDFCNP